MVKIVIAEGLIPIGQFKANAAACLKDLRSRGTMVITQNGKASAVILSPEEYDALLERQRLLEDVAVGLSDAEAGRTMSTSRLRSRLKNHRKG